MPITCVIGWRRHAAFGTRLSMATKTPRNRHAGRSRAQKSSAGARISSERAGRHQPSQTRAQATVDAILEAAGQLLVTRGRAAVTTNAVAARAGVSIGSLYQYFPNKGAIFEALQERHRGQVKPLIEHALSRLADPGEDIAEVIVTLMRALAELHRVNPERMRVLANELHDEGALVDIEAASKLTAKLLAQRYGTPASEWRATAWLTSVTMTHVGRSLVHQPPSVGLEELLEGVSRMLRGLFRTPTVGRS